MLLLKSMEDLVPKENVVAWLRYLRHDFPAIPLKCSTSNSRHHHSRSSVSDKGQGARHLLALLKSYRRTHASLTVGVVGPPNVGKSSLINALSRLRNDNKDVVTTGAKPGQTRDIKEVGLEKGVKVLDMPGIVWGDFLGDVLETANRDSKSLRVGSLSMIGVDSLEDPIDASAYESL
jgi:nuclear GTP-binding protein